MTRRPSEEYRVSRVVNRRPDPSASTRRTIRRNQWQYPRHENSSHNPAQSTALSAARRPVAQSSIIDNHIRGTKKLPRMATAASVRAPLKILSRLPLKGLQGYPMPFYTCVMCCYAPYLFIYLFIFINLLLVFIYRPHVLTPRSGGRFASLVLRPLLGFSAAPQIVSLL